MNINALEKLFENDLITTLKQRRPYWKCNKIEHLSDNKYTIFKIHLFESIFSTNNCFYVSFNNETSEYSFIRGNNQYDNIFSINDLIKYLEKSFKKDNWY